MLLEKWSLLLIWLLTMIGISWILFFIWIKEISVYLDGKVDSSFNRKAFFEELNQDYRFIFSHGKYACVNAQK